MPRHDHSIALRHMLDYPPTAVRLVADRAKRDLDTDEMLRLALTRAIEVIGEAAARVSTAGQEKYPNIPTRTMPTRHRNHGLQYLHLGGIKHTNDIRRPSH